MPLSEPVFIPRCGRSVASPSVIHSYFQELFASLSILYGHSPFRPQLVGSTWGHENTCIHAVRRAPSSVGNGQLASLRHHHVKDLRGHQRKLAEHSVQLQLQQYKPPIRQHEARYERLR